MARQKWRPPAPGRLGFQAAVELFDARGGALHPRHYHRYFMHRMSALVGAHSTRCAGARGEGKAIDRRLAGLDVCVRELHSGEPRCASLGALAFSWLDVQVMHGHEFGPCTARHWVLVRHDASARRCGAAHQHRQRPQAAAHPVAPRDLTIELNFCRLTSLVVCQPCCLHVRGTMHDGT